ERGEFGSRKIQHSLRRRKDIALQHFLLEIREHERLYQAYQDCGLLSYAFDLLEFARIRIDDSSQTAKARDQVFGSLLEISVGDGERQQHLQELIVKKGGRSGAFKPLSQSLPVAV